MQWKRSSDNHGVDHYRVFVDGVVVGSTSGRTFTVTGLDPETSYDFKVRPVDTSNNFGPRSKVVTASTTGENLLVVRKGSTWRYKDDDFDLGEAWHQPNFDETNWKSGDGEFGFGDGDEETVVNGGPSNDRTITFYFRIEFDVPDADQFSAIKLQLLRDDGAILFLNGTEILRDNLPGGNIGHNTTALSSVSGADESTYFVFTVDSGALIDGANALAVEIHQASSTSSDLSFDLKVTLLG